MTHITTLRELRSCIAADTAHSPATEQLAALDAAIAAAEARPDAQPMADEREAFEAWAAGRLAPLGKDHPWLVQSSSGEWLHGDMPAWWQAWQARAALAAPQPSAVLANNESPTAGMNLGERIAHVGGRTNAAGYVEFGSTMAVNALVQQIIRDMAPAQPQPSGNAAQAGWGADEVRVGEMTPGRAAWFLERFKREEKLLGPNEQWALEFAIAALAAQPSGRERRGSVTISGTQLLQALDFIAPDRDSDPQQLEGELTIQHGGGHAGDGYYAFLTDYPDEGATLLDGVLPDPADTQPSGQADLAGIAQEIIAASQMPPGERHDVTTDRVASILRRAFGWQAKAVTTPGDNAPAESMGGAPHRIYLVVGDDAEGAAFGDLHEVTWCADRQGPNDVEYVLGGQARRENP